MDPFQTNPLIALLLDIPVRAYFGFVQGFAMAAGALLALKLFGLRIKGE